MPLPVALWASGVLPTPVALGIGVFLIVLALVQFGLGTFDLHRSRRLGDALLRAYPGLPPIAGLAAWRSAELTLARNRRELARLVRLLRRETEACVSMGSPRVDRAVLDKSLVLLQLLESRLEMLTAPVSPLGILDVTELVTGGFGPLNFPERTNGLPAALTQALTALEPER